MSKRAAEVILNLVESYCPCNAADIKNPASANIPKFTPEIAKLPEFQGKAFRVHIENWGIPSKASVADIIRFEEEELGNQYNLPKPLMKELDRYRHDDVLWVGRSAEDVEDYLSEGMTKEDISEWEFPAGSKIITEDGFGGYFVLGGDAIPRNAKS